jgi:Protein of unknown function (DUF2786)
MSDDRSRLQKVLAVAINPGAVEGEAIAALRRARELVKQNPALAHPPAPPSSQPQPPERVAAPEATFRANITSVHPDWTLILVGRLLKEAYDLDLKHKVEFDFSRPLTGVLVTCEGSQSACESFSAQVEWCVNYVNDQLKTSP